MNPPQPELSIILPAYNEAEALGPVLDEILSLSLDAEIIVVNDGSTDDTADVVRTRSGVRSIDHPYNMGNGAAVKTGIRAAHGATIIMMDGDGQHQPTDIPRLAACTEKFDMAVGARASDSDAAAHRTLANRLYNIFASYVVGRQVKDLTSGFRAIRAPIAKQYVYLLPNGFSYPTTITIALFRAGHTVHYEPILAPARIGKSNIKLLSDGPGFLLTILRIGTLFAPLKIFLPVAAILLTTGIAYGAFILTTQRRFSNMAGLLVLSGIMLFMLGLISEQIALLRMAQSTQRSREDSA